MKNTEKCPACGKSKKLDLIVCSLCFYESFTSKGKVIPDYITTISQDIRYIIINAKKHLKSKKSK